MKTLSMFLQDMMTAANDFVDDVRKDAIIDTLRWSVNETCPHCRDHVGLMNGEHKTLLNGQALSSPCKAPIVRQRLEYELAAKRKR